MTSTIPLPHTPTLTHRLRVGLALGLDGAWTLAEEITYRAAGVAWRWPKVVVPGVLAATAVPGVSWDGVTGTILAGSMILIMRPGMRARIPSLHDQVKLKGRRVRIRAQWPRVCADTALTKPGADKDNPRTPRILKSTDTLVGVRLCVSGDSVSKSTYAFQAKAADIRTGLGAKDITISVHDQHTDIDLIYVDPFRVPIMARDMPAPSRPGLLVTGRDSYGQPVEESPYQHQLLVGASESGKSSKVWRLLQALQEAGIPHRVRVFDPKDGVEFAALEDSAYIYEKSPRKFAEFLEKAFRAYSARTAAMRAAGIKRLSEATDEWPLDIMIIDELITVLNMNKKHGVVRVDSTPLDVRDALMQYLSVGLGARHVVWGCSQLGQKEIIGPVVDLFTARTLLRVPSDDLVRVVFGDSKRFPAHEIQIGKHTAGIGFTEMDGVGVVKYRAAFLTDAERAKVALTMAEDTARYRSRTKWAENL